MACIHPWRTVCGLCKRCLQCCPGCTFGTGPANGKGKKGKGKKK